MDLDDFEEDALALTTANAPKSTSALHALAYIDNRWYARASRSARWMDLIGDYAGTEPFILDGDSLLQAVLDDDLLAIARDDDPSFQLAHALHSVERILNDFISRSAIFDVVFWNDLRHSTCRTGGTPFSVSSCRLARAFLFQHIRKLDINVHTFNDLADPEWYRYRNLRKPMFVMMNDGGMLEGRKSAQSAEHLLIQRSFMFDLLGQGISLTLLKGTEFRESKILSFVFEQRLDPKAREQLSSTVWEALHLAKASLAAKEADTEPPPVNLTVGASVDALELDGFLRELSKKASPDFNELLYVFIAHCVVLEELPLALRAQALAPLHANLIQTLLNSFLPTLFNNLEQLSHFHQRWIDVDGRIFAALLRVVTANGEPELAAAIGPTASKRVDAIWAPSRGSIPILRGFAQRFPAPKSNTQVARKSRPEPVRGLLPFSYEVLDEELHSIRIETVSEVSSPPLAAKEFMHFGRDAVFNDARHWHNHKRAILPKYLGGEDARPTDAWQRKKKLKRDQFFMANLDRHAQTLTGALGTPLQRIVIVPTGKRPAKAATLALPAPTEKGQPAKAKGKKGKEPPISSADKLRAKIKDDKNKQTKDDDPLKVWWTGHLVQMAKMSNVQRINHIDALARNPKTKEGWLSAETRLYRLHLEFNAWIDDPSHETQAVRDRYTVSVLRMAKAIYALPALTAAILGSLASALLALGLDALLPHLEARFVDPDAAPPDASRKLSFEFVKLVRKSGSAAHKFMPIDEHPVLWQLRVFGEYMDRSMDSAPDRRVQFDPDAWQRQVLDCIDEPAHSILVVAPTSAGKTFIAYYAMEKVLRESNDSIIVYVAPTKALVSQIAAEVYARFSKNLSEGSLWAVHTRDYRVHDPQKCQILVTVPEVLAIMLLSPPLARTWTPRIKRVILDEIHSIGQQEGGAVWEQILLLAPCPIIGLSATIGEPEAFNAWLQSVQKAHNFEHTFIHHPHRYSHLRKFTYPLSINPKREFAGLDEHESTARMRFLHPITMLGFGARSMPPDLALEPADTLSLYNAFLSCRQALPNADLEALDPTVFFDKAIPLKQRDVLNYETSLKAIIMDLMAASDPQDAKSPLKRVIECLEDPVIKKIPSMTLNTVPAKEAFRGNLIYLASDLHIAGDLPAIFFSFDRSICEIMAKDLLEDLESAEEEWRESSPEWKRKIRKWEEWKAGEKHRQKLAEQAKKAKKDPDAAGPSDGPDSSWEASFDPEEPSAPFSFANTTKYPKEDLANDIYRLVRWGNVEPWIVNALRRGIAVHHAGMNKQYRSLIESLFRQGFVRIMIATGTLALGINAPARTSVFAGDSPWLTALMYRQCAGRAGRRGYDLLGKVVFYGIALDRIQRLVLSKLPSIGGNFPLTSTMTLRLFNLLVGSNNADVAVKAVRSLLSLPQISVASTTGKEQLLHHLRFSIDYLRRARLIDEGGTPLNLYGLAAHLYYTEPSNLALVALFRAGVIHRICNQDSTEKAKREFIILMAHLFGRRRLPHAYTTQANLKDIVKRSPSIVILPPMPIFARKALIDHDAEILRVFMGYALTYAEQHEDDLGPEHQLPLSKIEYPLPSTTGGHSLFQDTLRNTAIAGTARSPFVATSGHSDHFHNVDELITTARAGLSLNRHAIPSMEHLTEEGIDPLNAYLLDFYAHGQVAALAAANGIRKGEVWYLLQDFDLCLMTIRGVVEELMVKASKQQHDGEGSADEEDDSGYATGTAPSVDPAEADDDAGAADAPEFKRPVNVTDEDWRVYEVVDRALREFNAKFKAMWA